MVSQSVTESIAWIYFQETNDIGAAIAAEKQIKRTVAIQKDRANRGRESEVAGLER
ncbi:MAG: hypothetical protein WCA22_11480 [Candidatus Binatus sp.]